MRGLLSKVKKILGKLIASVLQILAGSDFSTKFPHLIFSKQKFHIYFGYYDKSPLNKDKVLALAVPKSAHEDEAVQVGYFTVAPDFSKRGEFHKVDETRLWNWQQGSRLMWHPQHENVCVFNAIEAGAAKTVLFDVKTETKKFLPFPTYDMSPDGNFVLSLDFSELADKRPGYGYPALASASVDPLLKSSIVLYDINEKKVKFTISKDQLKQLLPADLAVEEGYFNHLSFSPNGKNFLFYFIANSGKKRLNFAIVCPVDRMDLKVLGLTGFMSHYTWTSDEGLVIFTKFNGKIGYYSFDLTTKDGSPKIFYPDFPVDGHPTYYKGILVTDCYPTWPSNRQELFRLIPGKPRDIIARFHTPFMFTGDVRCDLHPRVTDQGIFCDFPSLKSKVRQMVFIRNQSN